MRTLLMIVVLCISGPTIWGQFDCESTTSDSIQDVFRVEAEQLVLRNLNLDDLFDEIDLPIVPVHRAQAALQAIYDNNTLPNWAEVFERFNIRSTKEYPTRDFEIVVDKFFAQGLSVDGFDSFATDSTYISAAFEKLVLSYDLETLDRQFWSIENNSRGRNTIPMQARNGININLLLNELLAVKGIYDARPRDLESDFSRDISYIDLGESIEVTFHFSWNCDEDGLNCKETHEWIYRVYGDDCTSEFVRESGATLPVEEVNGLLSTGIFPNPATDRVFIQALGPTGEDIQVVLYNAIGQILQSQGVAANSGLIETEFSLLDYPVGMYFIGLLGPNGQVLTEKIFKQ